MIRHLYPIYVVEDSLSDFVHHGCCMSQACKKLLNESPCVVSPWKEPLQKKTLITVFKHLRKQVIKSELWFASSGEGVLPCYPGIPQMSSPAGEQDPGEILHLQKLKVEMCHVDRRKRAQ